MLFFGIIRLVINFTLNEDFGLIKVSLDKYTKKSSPGKKNNPLL